MGNVPPISYTAQDVKRFWSKVHKTETCWEWTAGRGGYKGGYGGFYLKSKRHTYAHRFSYTIHYGAIPDGLFVCHKCDNPLCVRPDHLYAGTAAQNTRDAVERGLIQRGIASGAYRASVDNPVLTKWQPPVPVATANRGAANGMAKLSPEQVQEIRTILMRKQATRTEVAERFNVTRATIYGVMSGASWRWLPFPDIGDE